MEGRCEKRQEPLHKWRTSLVVVIQLSLLTITLRIPFADANGLHAHQNPIYSPGAFSENQTAAIALGQTRSSYGILDAEGGLAFDHSGNLWVADSYNDRILEFSPPFSDNMSATLALGQMNFVTPKQQQGTCGSGLICPVGVAFDRYGNLWVSDTSNNRVLMFQPPFHSGMSASMVIGQPIFSSQTPFLRRDGLAGPWGIAFDASGNLWVADSGNDRVVEFQPPFSSGMLASLVVGEPDFSHDNCAIPAQSNNGKCGTLSILNMPWQVAFDPSGDLWVAEGWNSGRLLEFKAPFANGMEASLLTEPIYVYSLAFDPPGDLWLAGAVGVGGVSEFVPPFNDTMRPVMSLGGYPYPCPGYSCSSLPIIWPSGLAFDQAGNLWVNDWLGTYGWPGRILGFNAQIHSVATSTGRVYFENQEGLLSPLSWVKVNQVDSTAFPEGLFNFTIQGLPAGGSVKVTISFPNLQYQSGLTWSIINRNSTGNGFEAHKIPPSQIQVEENNMTMTLSNASSTGVISVVGGPSYPLSNATTASETSITSIMMTTPLSSQNANVPLTFVLGALAIAVVFVVAIVFRKRRSNSRFA